MKTWSIVIPALALAVVQPAAVQPPRLALELQEYASMPITGELDGQNTRGNWPGSTSCGTSLAAAASS